MAPAEDHISWDTKTPHKIRIGEEAPANYAPMCIQSMMRNTVKEFPDNKVEYMYFTTFLATSSKQVQGGASGPGWWTIISTVPSPCPAALSILPDSHLCQQNLADGGTTKNRVNPTQVRDLTPNPVECTERGVLSVPRFCRQCFGKFPLLIG